MHRRPFVGWIKKKLKRNSYSHIHRGRERERVRGWERNRERDKVKQRQNAVKTDTRKLHAINSRWKIIQPLPAVGNFNFFVIHGFLYLFVPLTTPMLRQFVWLCLLRGWCLMLEIGIIQCTCRPYLMHNVLTLRYLSCFAVTIYTVNIIFTSSCV